MDEADEREHRAPPWRSRAQRLRWGLVAAASTAVVALGLSGIVGATASAPPDTGGAASPASTAGVAEPTATAPPAGGGIGRDQLTPAELRQAKTAAANGLTGTDVKGAPGPEYLSFELAAPKPGEDGPDAPRRAAVYFYDYTSEKLIKRVVNLRTGAVEGTFSRGRMQPPPSERETAEAVAIFLAHPLSADFKARFGRAAGRAFTSASQVQATATTYTARPADTGADQCGASRCVQLFTRVPNGPFIDITDIVIDLSGRTVARLR
ncbi:hypothetical protein [Actinomadura sp. SCN-SB]|uniref:hypothetical protein n=1 Tax=Actinomadura sp. SCN-SB TaxID=3373092 RepID=UPI003750799F